MTAGGPPDSDFLERPAFRGAVPPPPAFLFEPGQILAGRFRILRPIGFGGMGEVYAVHDLELQTDVALKTIRSTIADDPRAVEQFRGEVLRARSVSHRHVCRVHDLFAHEGPGGVVRFLTMELLDGETLAGRLARDGPLALDAAARFGRQMAAALDEAHRCGVVHRDFKPGNVLLVDDGDGLERVVVTDFGLARLSGEGGAGAPSSGMGPAGTADYMAPELFGEGPGGPAVDIYSYGVVLHEMLTGRTPARQQAIGAALPEAAEPEAAMPRRWRQAIAICLQADPARRPSTATAAIQRATGELARQRRRAFLTIGTAAVLLAMALYAPLSRWWRVTPRLAPNPTIFVGAVENATGNPELDATGDLLRRQLEQSPRLAVLEGDTVRSTLRAMALPPDAPLETERAREVMWRAGAAGFVTGRIRRAGSSYALSLRLESASGQPDRPGASWARAYEARDQDELMRRIRDAANWVREAAGEAAAEIPLHDLPVAEVTTSSWQALHLYARGEALVAESRTNDGLALWSEALRLDPGFTLASMRMGDVLMSEGRFDEAYRQWDRTVELLRQRRLGSREEYRIRGMVASDTDDHEEAVRVYRLYLVAFPADFRPYFYIARPLSMLGRDDEAIAMLQQARLRRPNDLSVLAQLAMFQLRAGRLAAAQADIERLRNLGHADWAACLDAQRAFLEGAYDRALEGFRGLEASSDAFLRGRAPALQAAVYADLGRLDAAIELLERGADDDARRGDAAARVDKLLGRADLELRRGQARACRDLCVQAEQIDRSPPRLGRIAALYAQSGDPGSAARILAQLPESSPSRRVRIDRIRLDGEIRLARGDVRGAWIELQRAAAMEAPGVLIEYLARGAAAAGERGTALALYERLARDPGYYWRYPGEEPGRWFDAITRYDTLSAGRRSETADAFRARRAALAAFTLPDRRSR